MELINRQSHLPILSMRTRRWWESIICLLAYWKSIWWKCIGVYEIPTCVWWATSLQPLVRSLKKPLVKFPWKAITLQILVLWTSWNLKCSMFTQSHLCDWNTVQRSFQEPVTMSPFLLNSVYWSQHMHDGLDASNFPGFWTHWINWDGVGWRGLHDGPQK